MYQNAIDGKVVSINEAGDLVTDIPNERVGDIENSGQVKIEIGAHDTIGVHPADHNERAGTLSTIMGSSGFLEVGITGCNINEMLGLKAEQSVKIRW